MKVVFIGDVHGYMDRYAGLVGKISKLGKEYRTFQLGDVGLGFPNARLKPMGKQHKFIRGNHDDPAACRKHPNYAGDFGYDHFFWIGGGYSVDHDWRRRRMLIDPRPIWWHDEQLYPDEMTKAAQLYVQVKPEIVVTHECPASVAYELYRAGSPTALYVPREPRMYEGYYSERDDDYSRTAKFLESLLEMHRPKLWVFGHHHVNWSVELEGTKFVCVDELKTYTVDIDGPK